MLVFFSHAQMERLGAGWVAPLGEYGREAVMIFFVLSGYVIAHVTSTKESTGLDYATSRFGRLYSVVLPGLVLTVLADQVGRQVDADFYQGDWYVDSFPVVRFLASLVFVNEFWTESIRPFPNGPFWSMSYEASYYLIFGLWTYLAPAQRRWLVPLALALVGPKILLLFPVWLFGVWAYRLNQRWRASRGLGWLLFLGSIAAIIALSELRFANLTLDLTAAWLGEDLVHQHLHYSKFFVNSYVIGVLVALNFIGVKAIASDLAAVLEPCARPIIFLAQFTFAIYLFHYPLLHLFRTVTDSSVVMCVATLAVIVAVGGYCESSKKAYKRAFTYLLSGVMVRLASARS